MSSAFSSNEFAKRTLRNKIDQAKVEDGIRYGSMYVRIDSNYNEHKWIEENKILEEMCIVLDGKMNFDNSFSIDYYLNERGVKVNLSKPTNIKIGDIMDVINELLAKNPKT